MTTPRRRSLRTLLILPALLCAAAVTANAQVNSRPLRPAEQAFLDKLAAEFAKILPPVPAGWAEVERRIYDAGGNTSDWDAPIQADYQVQLVSKDLEARQKIVQQRDQELSDKNREAFEAQTAKNEKAMADFGVKLQAAMEKKDMAAVEKLQADLEKQMAASAKGPPIAPRPELSDTYAHIGITINPYNAGSHASAKTMQLPTGFTAVGRTEPGDANSDREGVTSYLIGQWTPDGGSGYTLKFTPNKGTIVYGIVVAIEARADRADALFKAMNITRLKALLQQ